MAYAQIDFEFWSNPKVLAAGKDAALLYIAGCGYCNQHLTDGFVSDSAVGFVANMAQQRSYRKHVNALVENGLWLKVEDGYLVNDFLKHNKSKAEVDALREKKSKAGQASARAREQQGAGNKPSTRSTGVQTDVEQVLNNKVVEHAFNYIDIDSDVSLKDTTTPPFNPPTNSDDSEKPADPRFDALFMAYQSETGKSPQFDAAEVELIAAMLADDVTPDELRVALREMTAKGFACPRISSARNWIVNNREKKKRKGRQPVKEKPGLAGGYVPSTLSEIVVEG